MNTWTLRQDNKTVNKPYITTSNNQVLAFRTLRALLDYNQLSKDDLIKAQSNTLNKGIEVINGIEYHVKQTIDCEKIGLKYLIKNSDKTIWLDHVIS